MSEPQNTGEAAVHKAHPYNPKVERIIQLGDLLLAALEPIHKMVAERTGKISPEAERLHAERERLQALSPGELVRELAQAEARAEAQRFFNLPSSVADYAHWTLVERWSIDQSVALLLGRNPDIVSWDKLKKYKYLASPFVQRYAKLLQIAQGADIFRHQRIRPAEVWQWATRTQIISAPSSFTHWLRARGLIVEEATSAAGENISEGVVSDGPGTRWTAERRRALKAFRETHGTAAAAKQFGISAARVRQLLPSEKDQPQIQTSVFDLGRRK